MLTLRAILATSFTLLACVPAAAQFRLERPYRGIFASGIDTVGQSITASTTFSGGYDDNVLAGTHHQPAVSANQPGGTIAQLSGGVNYLLTYERVTFTAGAASSYRYYPSLGNEVVDTHNASVGGVVNILRRPSLSVRGSINYRPYTFVSALPEPDEPVEVAAPPEPDFVPVATQFVTYRAGASFNQRLARRVTFSSDYHYYTANRLERDFWRQGAGANLGYNVTRDVQVHLGYAYTEGHYDDRLYRTHRPVLDVTFSRALSLTRNTSVSGGAGTTTTAVDGEVQTRLRAIGNARINHEIGRSWTLTGVYNRGVYYVETLPEPVFSNSLRASLVGLLTRRLQFQATTAASFGQSGFSSHARPYDMYLTTVGLSSAITRFMNVGVNYAYYVHDFDEAITLDPGVPHRLDRQSLRGYITLWAPILNRTRKPNAAR